MSMTLRILGCGDAFSTGGQLHTALLLDVPSEGGEEAAGRYLIDCGATTLLALQRAGIATDSIDGAVISHLHGDHVGGLPYVLLEAEHLAGRERPFTVAGPEGTRARVETLNEALYPSRPSQDGDDGPPFPIDWVRLAPEESSEVGPLRVTAFAAVHPSGAPSLMLRIEAAGGVFAFSGDTGWTEDLFRVARGADLFVCECSTFDYPLAFHLDYRALLDRRDDFACSRLLLTHLGPDILARARAGELEIEHAEDGMIVEI